MTPEQRERLIEKLKAPARMSSHADIRTFTNDELVLQVSKSVDPALWNEVLYEGFIDSLCVTRQYQAEAIRTINRYLYGGAYGSLRDLAEENYNSNDVLGDRYFATCAYWPSVDLAYPNSFRRRAATSRLRPRARSWRQRSPSFH